MSLDRLIKLLLIFIPIAIIAKLAGAEPVPVFILSALGIVPLADLIGKATEELAIHTGPKLGGLLNATLGNAAELIITIFAIREGLLDLVRASIVGSILGNLLLVMGMSLLAGGLKNRGFAWSAAFRRLMLHPSLGGLAGRAAGPALTRLAVRALTGG